MTPTDANDEQRSFPRSPAFPAAATYVRDFGPLEVLRNLLIDLKLGRHYKGTFWLTKVGQSAVKKPKDRKRWLGTTVSLA